jgi:hypothetical protein
MRRCYAQRKKRVVKVIGRARAFFFPALMLMPAAGTIVMRDWMGLFIVVVLIVADINVTLRLEGNPP